MPQQPPFSLSPGQPAIPGQLPGALPGLTQNGLPGLPQNGLNLPGQQPALGGIPSNIQKRNIDEALGRPFSIPAGFTPPVFGGSNQPIIFSASPPLVVKRNADLVAAVTGSTPAIRAKRGLFGGDETTPHVILPVAGASVPTGLPRQKRGLFGSESASSSLPFLSSVTPALKRR